MALTLVFFFLDTRQSAGVTWVLAGAAAVGSAGAGGGGRGGSSAGDFPVANFFSPYFLKKIQV